MNIIDHRILIPASQEKVWQHISDVTRNPQWQVDCKSVSILTTMRSGAGMRWRYTTHGGQEYVVEVTAWYDRLGYEYHLVDAPFRSNKGLIRLQELPEGTIVQWTFNYEPTGLFGGLQNTLSIKRRTEKEMVDSLRALYRYIGKAADNEIVQAKSLMREAPDVESRAHYKPRHPSALQDQSPTTQSNLVNEPAALEDDTRPNPVLTTAGVREPDFLANIATTETNIPPSADTEARFKPPATEPTRVVPPEAPLETRPALLNTVPPQRPLPVTPEVVPQEETVEYELPLLKETSTSEIDTSKISVFEIFGLPKPSETQEMRAFSEQALADKETIITPAVTPQNKLTQSTTIVQALLPDRRVGLRIKLRRNIVHLRRPS